MFLKCSTLSRASCCRHLRGPPQQVRQKKMIEAPDPFDRSVSKKIPARALRLGIPLHGIDPEKSLFLEPPVEGRFSNYSNVLELKHRRGKYAQISQMSALQAKLLIGTEAPLAKAPANRLSQRPASFPAGQPRPRPDTTR